MRSFAIAFVAFALHALCAELGEFEKLHMAEIHDIEISSVVAFFKLHDRNKDGFWDEEELRYMYGMEAKTDPNTNHINLIIDGVFKTMDKNGDRLISLDEYTNAKLPMVNQKQQKPEEKLKGKRSLASDKLSDTKERIPNKFRA